ncbi:uncharacterized protein [Argopecten irradians]|uniref:uncharacterized protein n=1 Tax=Argopecten irradians TaxID=31199 RepID=UPI003711E7BD
MTWQTVLLLLGLAVSMVLARNVNRDVNGKATDKREISFQGAMFEEWQEYLELQKTEERIRAQQEEKWAKVKEEYEDKYRMNGINGCSCFTIKRNGKDIEKCFPHGCDPDNAEFKENDA